MLSSNWKTRFYIFNWYCISKAWFLLFYFCLLSLLFFLNMYSLHGGERLYFVRGRCNKSAKRLCMNYSLTSHKTSVKRIMIPNFSSLICISMCQIFLWKLKVLKVSNILKPGKKTRLCQSSSMALVNYTRLNFL